MNKFQKYIYAILKHIEENINSLNKEIENKSNASYKYYKKEFKKLEERLLEMEREKKLYDFNYKLLVDNKSKVNKTLKKLYYKPKRKERIIDTWN